MRKHDLASQRGRRLVDFLQLLRACVLCSLLRSQRRQLAQLLSPLSITGAIRLHPLLDSRPQRRQINCLDRDDGEHHDRNCYRQEHSTCPVHHGISPKI